MRGASVERHQATPKYVELVDPKPLSDETLIHVEAAALSNLVRAQASGEHYSSGSKYPFTPGNDGVGTRDDGKRVYFLSPRSPFGSMAQISVVKRSQTIELPSSIASETAAAMGNPGLATWGALLGRAAFLRGEVLLINGATGISGRAAIQVAHKLGASRVIATGRSGPGLEDLTAAGADRLQSVSLNREQLIEDFRMILREERVDVVLDFLWGQSAECFFKAAMGRGDADKCPRIRYVEVGSVSGDDVRLPAAVLRSSGIELLGSGLGSLGMDEILACLAQMFDSWAPHDRGPVLAVEPLQNVETAWNEDLPGRRLVFRP